MKNTLIFKEKIKLNCGRFLDVSLERNYTLKKDAVCYINAVMPNGFDLCNIHYGILKNKVSLNSRLRSKKSKLNELNQVFNSIVDYFKNLNGLILDHGEIFKTNIKLKSDYIVIPNLAGENIFKTNSLKSTLSKVPVSWFYHDVYRLNEKIQVTVIRNKKGYLEFFAEDHDLYDLKKLNKLAESENFKVRRYSFFFYDEVLRLTGKPYLDSNNMSGLF